MTDPFLSDFLAAGVEADEVPELAALNTARGRIARACFRPMLGTPDRLLPAAPPSNQGDLF